MVVDGTSEIAGDGRVPHACIGRARRMPVPDGRSQAEVALEAVQNHSPEVCSHPALKHARVAACCASGAHVEQQARRAYAKPMQALASISP